MNKTSSSNKMTEKEATRQAAKELGIQVVTRMNKGKLARRSKEILNNMNKTQDVKELASQVPWLTPPTVAEVTEAIRFLNRFYSFAPFGEREIEHTVDALDEYRNQIS